MHINPAFTVEKSDRLTVGTGILCSANDLALRVTFL